VSWCRVWWVVVTAIVVVMVVGADTGCTLQYVLRAVLYSLILVTSVQAKLKLTALQHCSAAGANC
jgi:hypothetical protein